MALTHTYLSGITAAVTNRYVASANMKVGAYTIANATAAVAGARQVTVTHTQVGGVTDTLGTIVVVGKDLHGQTITETLTPVSASTVTSTKFFASVTSVTGVGWVINTGNDTIVVGHAAASIVAQGGGTVAKVVIGTTAAGAITLADSAGTIAVFKTSIVEGEYALDVPYSGFLSVTVVAASTVTIAHSPGVPSAYAMA